MVATSGHRVTFLHTADEPEWGGPKGSDWALDFFLGISIFVFFFVIRKF